MCVAVIAALALLIWMTRRPTGTVVSSPSATGDTVDSTERDGDAAHRRGETPGKRTNAVSVATTPSATTSPPPSETKEEQARTVLSKMNDVPIIFYGRVQDQFGNPVADAEIIGSIIVDNGKVEGTSKVSAISDASGLFQLNGGQGESIGVMPRKEGYALASTETEFKYSHFYPESRHVPDPSKPVVFKMWKLQGGEPLVHFQFKARVPCNGASVAFDLQTGQRVESGGDIIIRVESSPAPNVMEKYNWEAKIQPVNGGVVLYEGRMESVFLAPEGGYEPEFVISQQKDSQPWQSGFNGSFYLKSRGGRSYGKIDLGIITDTVKEGSIPIMMSGYVNPAGSRNVEVNPALVTEAKP